MALLSEIESALMLGITVELLNSYTKYCPKSGENVKLKYKIVKGIKHFEKDDILFYHKYLNSPWPMPKKGERPYIPKAIQDFIKFESHYSCSICGHMDNGEIAHIEAVSTTLNNSPDNLIYLCPNHHTKYDYGYKPNSNVTLEEIRASKLLKRNALQRVMKYESNTVKLLKVTLLNIKSISEKLAFESDKTMLEIYNVELQNIVKNLPEYIDKANDDAKKDISLVNEKELLSKNAPNLIKYSNIIIKDSSLFKTSVDSIIKISNEIFIDLDEYPCPHCGGSGLTGLLGDICVYCKGSCVVSKQMVNSYDSNKIDEVECPHCGGSGLTGLLGNICIYCKGSRRVSHKKFDQYDPDKIDEVDCPRCGGSGLTGLLGDICTYCKGSRRVSHKKFDEYDPDETNEVECPHCRGSGLSGLVGNVCKLCKG